MTNNKNNDSDALQTAIAALQAKGYNLTTATAIALGQRGGTGTAPLPVRTGFNLS